jgi:hypothetical protein
MRKSHLGALDAVPVGVPLAADQLTVLFFPNFPPGILGGGRASGFTRNLQGGNDGEIPHS